MSEQPAPTKTAKTFEESCHAMALAKLKAANIAYLSDRWDLFAMFLDRSGVPRSEWEGWLRRRCEQGIETYGGALTPFNGRDARTDMLEEIFDAAAYLGQQQMEDEACLSSTQYM